MPDFDEYDYRLHENTYYWAVAIHLKSQNKYTPQWWKDKSLWPPPQDYLQRTYSVFHNETQNKDIADLKEDLEYLTNALDKKIEHRDARLSGSITQIQSYLFG